MPAPRTHSGPLSISLLLSLLVAGCEEVASEKPAAIALNQTLESAGKDAEKALEIYGKVYGPAAHGQPVDPASFEAAYEKGLTLLHEAIAKARAAEGPKTYSAASYKQAVLLSLEGTERRYTTKLREVSKMALDPKLTLEQKRDKGGPLIDEMEQEAKAEEELKRQAQGAFAAEFKIDLRPATSK